MINNNMDKAQLQLNEANFWDRAAALYLIYRINTDIKKWDAYKLGLIDDKGNILKQPKTQEEKRALSSFDRLILFIRRHLPLVALRLISAYSVYKLLTENESECGELVEDVESSKQIAFLYTRMLDEAYERGITHDQVVQWLFLSKK